MRQVTANIKQLSTISFRIDSSNWYYNITCCNQIYLSYPIKTMMWCYINDYCSIYAFAFMVKTFRFSISYIFYQIPPLQYATYSLHICPILQKLNLILYRKLKFQCVHRTNKNRTHIVGFLILISFYFPFHQVWTKRRTTLANKLQRLLSPVKLKI